MDNGWNRIGEDMKVKEEFLMKGKYVFVLEDGERKEKKCFEMENMFLEEDVLVDLKRHFSSQVEVPPPSY